MKRLFSIHTFASLAAGLLFIVFALSSCSAYRLGTGSTPGFRSIYVAPVVNESTELPQSVALFTTQIREALARDGRVKLANSPGTADAVLRIRINQFRRDGAMAQPEDTGLSRKFVLRLSGHATLTQGNTELFKERPFQTEVEVFSDNPRQAGTYDALIQSEYQAMPVLAENLAKTVKGMLLDTW